MLHDEVARRAYLAGLLDGEGYIGIKRRMPTKANHMRSPKYSAAITIAMTDLEPILLVARFCDSIDLVRSRERAPHHKRIWEFEVESERAEMLLRAVLPYLVVKQTQAAACLELISIMRPRGGGGLLSAETVARREQLYQRCLRGSPRSGQKGRWKGVDTRY